LVPYLGRKCAQREFFNRLLPSTYSGEYRYEGEGRGS
jgi:hypothetical protein